MSDIVWAKPKSAGRCCHTSDLLITKRKCKGIYYFAFSFKAGIPGIDAKIKYCIGFDYDSGKVYVKPDKKGYAMVCPGSTTRHHIRIPFVSFGNGSFQMLGEYKYSCSNDIGIVFEREG